MTSMIGTPPKKKSLSSSDHTWMAGCGCRRLPLYIITVAISAFFVPHCLAVA